MSAFSHGKLVDADDLIMQIIDNQIKNGLYWSGWVSTCLCGQDVENAISQMPEYPRVAEWNYSTRNYDWGWVEADNEVKCSNCGYKEDLNRMQNYCPRCGYKIKPVLMKRETKKRLMEKYRRDE